uniref:Uncharacterized protein n=1 Tax=Sphaerodactylus townsendi TaxID=933632 RepID=A0ACB8FP95_9SAUR
MIIGKDTHLTIEEPYHRYRTPSSIHFINFNHSPLQPRLPPDHRARPGTSCEAGTPPPPAPPACGAAGRDCSRPGSVRPAEPPAAAPGISAAVSAGRRRGPGRPGRLASSLPSLSPGPGRPSSVGGAGAASASTEGLPASSIRRRAGRRASRPRGRAGDDGGGPPEPWGEAGRAEDGGGGGSGKSGEGWAPAGRAEDGGGGGSGKSGEGVMKMSKSISLTQRREQIKKKHRVKAFQELSLDANVEDSVVEPICVEAVAYQHCND